jgi:hypothetical protein
LYQEDFPILLQGDTSMNAKFLVPVSHISTASVPPNLPLKNNTYIFNSQRIIGAYALIINMIQTDLHFCIRATGKQEVGKYPDMGI